MKLYDLVEFQFDHHKKVFVKKCTHKYNLPKAICYSEKKKIEFLTPVSLHTRFRVVPNGQLQYSNQFKMKKKKTNSTTVAIQNGELRN